MVSALTKFKLCSMDILSASLYLGILIFLVSDTHKYLHTATAGPDPARHKQIIKSKKLKVKPHCTHICSSCFVRYRIKINKYLAEPTERMSITRTSSSMQTLFHSTTHSLRKNYSGLRQTLASQKSFLKKCQCRPLTEEKTRYRTFKLEVVPWFVFAAFFFF
jgi:hypothetical protein